MKLLICGSRSITDFDFSKYIPGDVKLIISGGAKGIDDLAERYADKKHISKLILRPEYSIYGKGAPLKRNEKMVDIADMILIVWDGRSKGTNYTLNYAQKKGKPFVIVEINK